jgi:hypothetical protein
MRKVKSFFAKALLFACALQAGGLAFAAKKSNKPKGTKMPEWVARPSAVYPSESYISAVGSAADRSASEVNALEGLASVFGQSISSDATASRRMVQAKEDGLVASSNFQAFSQDVRRKVDIDCLIGVEIKEFWEDVSRGTWHAVAVLDRKKAAVIYSDLIKKNYSAIETALNSAESDKNSFDGFGSCDFAEEAALENEKYLQRLSTIDSSCVEGLKRYCPPSKKIHAQKMEIAKEIPICVQTFNDEHGRYKEAFLKAISAVGFKGTVDDSVRYTLMAKFAFERSDTRDGKTVRCRYNCESCIIDSKTGLQIVPFAVKGRESHTDYKEAQRKAESALIEKITKDFSKAFYDYIRSL